MPCKPSSQTIWLMDLPLSKLMLWKQCVCPGHAYGAALTTFEANLRNWDFAVEGSPSSSTLMSPLRWVPSGSDCMPSAGAGGSACVHLRTYARLYSCIHQPG